MKPRLLIFVAVVMTLFLALAAVAYADGNTLDFSEPNVELGIEDFDLDEGIVKYESTVVYVENRNADITRMTVEDTKVVVCSFDENEIHIHGVGPGKTTITVTSSNNATGVLNVEVKVPETYAFSLDYDDDKHLEEIYVDSFDPERDSTIVQLNGLVTEVRSEDESIVSIDDYEDYKYGGAIGAFTYTPKAAGKTEFVIKDFFGNELRIPVEFTQKGLDEARYLPFFIAYESNIFSVAGENYIRASLPDDEYLGITEEDLKNITISASGDGVDVVDVAGEKDASEAESIWYNYEAKLGRKAIWKEKFKVTLKLGEASFTTDIISKKSVDTKNVKATVSDVIYTGKSCEPKPVVKINGVSLKIDKDFSFWCDNNKNVGKANMVIYDTKTCPYSFYKELSFKINPKGTTMNKPTAQKKALTAKWKTLSTKMSKSRITGYQVQVATNSKFTKNKKLVTVKGYTKKSVKVTKLKAKTTYYVRVRTYMNVKGKNYYSKWSAYKKIKTK